MGLSSRAEAADVRDAVGAVLAQAGWRWEDVTVVATSTRFEHDPRLTQLALSIAAYRDAELYAVAVPTPPAAALGRGGRSPGTAPGHGGRRPPVAEASALLAAGPGARMVVAKRAGRYVTVAAAEASPGSPNRRGTDGLGPGPGFGPGFGPGLGPGLAEWQIDPDFLPSIRHSMRAEP